MDWWNELWLNEGFATWVGWYAIDHLYPGKYLDLLPVRSFAYEWSSQSGTYGANLSYVESPEVFKRTPEC
jgi:aminopeptidase N